MRSWTFMQWVIAIIVVCAAAAIMFIALPAMGIIIPAWAMNMVWVVVIAFVAICAVGLLVMMWNNWGSGGPP